MPIRYHEWFDWSELFSAEGPERLLSIADAFSSEFILISGVLTDCSSELLNLVRVVKILPSKLREEYFRGIWDGNSMHPSGALAAAARMILLWDESRQWVIICDRYYEIGLFAIFAAEQPNAIRAIFHTLDERGILERFSRILKMNKVAARTELERWSETDRN
jgi:hypothetical protein